MEAVLLPAASLPWATSPSSCWLRYFSSVQLPKPVKNKLQLKPEKGCFSTLICLGWAYRIAWHFLLNSSSVFIPIFRHFSSNLQGGWTAFRNQLKISWQIALLCSHYPLEFKQFHASLPTPTKINGCNWDIASKCSSHGRAPSVRASRTKWMQGKGCFYSKLLSSDTARYLACSLMSNSV